MKYRDFPPMTAKEAQARYLGGLDFVLVSGDAYVDHPSFGAAVIARVLMGQGYSVGVIAQPDWKSAEDFRRLGRPKLAFLVTAGNLDSMVNHYTAGKRPRSEDAYSEGGAAGKRPDRAAIVYANRCRQAYPGVPIILGGLEASLRRFAHYDYWDDKVRHSMLYDAGADILVYGMGERAIVAIADAFAPLSEGGRRRSRQGGVEGESWRSQRGGVPKNIPGTCYQAPNLEGLTNYELLPSFSEVAGDRRKYAAAFMAQLQQGKVLVQPHEKGYLVANPPAAPLTTTEMDAVSALPFTRKPHPVYTKPIPALAEVEFSLTSSRGCFGGCSFCSLTFHQGKSISARSHDSLLVEAKALTKSPNFRGYIHDVGGPTANFRAPACKKSRPCPNKACIGYRKCNKLEVSHSDYVALLRKLRQVPGVKKVFVRSGVRYDYALYDPDETFLRELTRHHVSGQLKIAPEHIADRVLYYMNKPPAELYERFLLKYRKLSEGAGQKQYVVPYLMSSHPGCTLGDAIDLALYLKKSGHRPEQVQDFYPTPGTLSTCMYHTGLDPRTGEEVYVPRAEREKRLQRALMQYYLPKNRSLVREALRLAGREDLIGPGKLVPPEKPKQGGNHVKPKPGNKKPDKNIRKGHRAK